MPQISIHSGGSRLSLPSVDPARFNDPIALKAEWNSTRTFKSGFKSYKLSRVNTGRMEYEITMAYKLVWAVFFIIGIALLCLRLFLLKLPVILCGLFFAVFGAYVIYQAQPIVFDNSEGTFSKGRKHPNIEKLRNVHGLQLITTILSGKQKSTYCYELNFVLNDGKRVNIISHSNKEAIIKDAHSLGEFLGKPVWNAIF